MIANTPAPSPTPPRMEMLILLSSKPGDTPGLRPEWTPLGTMIAVDGIDAAMAAAMFGLPQIPAPACAAQR